MRLVIVESRTARLCRSKSTASSSLSNRRQSLIRFISVCSVCCVLNVSLLFRVCQSLRIHLQTMSTHSKAKLEVFVFYFFLTKIFDSQTSKIDEVLTSVRISSSHNTDDNENNDDKYDLNLLILFILFFLSHRFVVLVQQLPRHQHRQQHRHRRAIRTRANLQIAKARQLSVAV